MFSTGSLLLLAYLKIFLFVRVHVCVCLHEFMCTDVRGTGVIGCCNLPDTGAGN